MEKTIVASKTISGFGYPDFLTKCKQAEKEGWEMYGNPLTNREVINQVVVKFKVNEEYK